MKSKLKRDSGRVPLSGLCPRKHKKISLILSLLKSVLLEKQAAFMEC